MGTAYNPKIVTDGLVLCLDAANRKSYPGSGTSWTDLSGNGNTGTLTNGPTLSSSNGGSIVFDGVDDLITVPNGNYLNTNEWTFSCWVYQDNITTTFTQATLLGKNVYNTSGISAALGTGGSLGNRIFNLRYSTTNSLAATHIFTPSASLVTFDAWHQITLVMTYSNPNSTLLLYIDGQYDSAATSASGTFVSNTQQLSIGNPSAGQANYYHKGRLGTYQMYNRALTAAEISQNFQATRGRYGI